MASARTKKAVPIRIQSLEGNIYSLTGYKAGELDLFGHGRVDFGRRQCDAVLIAVVKTHPKLLRGPLPA